MDPKSLRIVILAIHLVSAFMLMGLAWPMWKEKIPPNGLYGFRVAKTMADEKVWYAANAFSGQGIFWVGFALMAYALVFFGLRGVGPLPYLFLGLAVEILGAAGVIIATFRFLSKFP